MFAVAGAIPQIKRLYIYDWTGGTSSTRFDAGLTNSHNQPREGYAVVCKALQRERLLQREAGQRLGRRTAAASCR